MDDGSIKLGKMYMENRYSHLAWDPAALLSKGLQYFQFCRDNPKYKQITDKNGDVQNIELPRAPTKEGLSLYLGISKKTLENYYKRPEFEDAIGTLIGMIHDNQITGGMVDTYNANLVARYTGLSDKKEVEQKTSVEVSSKDELQEELNKLLGKQDGRGEGNKVAISKDTNTSTDNDS